MLLNLLTLYGLIAYKGNLALMKTATQHVTLHNHGPELGVDGDRDLNVNNEGCAKPYSYDP